MTGKITRKVLGRLQRALVLVMVLSLVLPYVAFGAELVTSEVEGNANKVTVEQGGSANFDIKLSATGSMASTITPASPAKVQVKTSYSITTSTSNVTSVAASNLSGVTSCIFCNLGRQ